jgi:iron(III) transport system ATP-binding protein
MAAQGAHGVTGPAMVGLRGVSRRFGATAALSGLSLEVRRGETLCLAGPSGSGKSTLLRIIAGLERPDEGEVVLDGTVVDGADAFVPAEGRRVGMVFQDFALFPHLSVADNVAFGLRGLTRREVEERVGRLLDAVGLAGFQARAPHTLSGGERQRVALARALAPEPRVLLMDEPFSSLDGRLREQVRDDTAALLVTLDTTVIVVTHDPDEALALGDRLALLQAGRLVQCDTPEAMYRRPTSSFAARFFGAVNVLPETCRDGVVATPVGPVAAPAMADRTAVDLCIRPHDLRIASAPTPLAGRVVECRFRGGWHAVDIEVAWGPTRPLLRLYTVDPVPPPGAQVHLTVDLRRAVVTAAGAA